MERPGASNADDYFSAYSTRLHAIRWLTTIEPVGIKKFNGDSDPKMWLRTYSIVIRDAYGTYDMWPSNFQ
jgi:hypothetical protein